jgi:hypothetical protein
MRLMIGRVVARVPIRVAQISTVPLVSDVLYSGCSQPITISTKTWKPDQIHYAANPLQLYKYSECHTIFINDHHNGGGGSEVSVWVSGGDVNKEVLTQLILIIIEYCHVEAVLCHVRSEGEGYRVGLVVFIV